MHSLSSRPARRAAGFAAVAFVAISVLGAAPAYAAPEPWSDPVELADNSPSLYANVVMPNGTIVGTLETDAGLATVTSLDAGATWSAPVYVGTVAYPFRSSIASTSTGILAVTWVEDDLVRSIFVSTSADAGATWTPPAPLPASGDFVDDPIVVSSSPNGFTIVWNDSFTKRGVASIDGGATWSAPEVLTENLNSYGAVSLVPVATGDIVAIFQEFDGLLGEYSIQSRRSTDGGLTWGTKVAVAPSWSGTLGNGLYVVGVSPASGSIVAAWTRGVGDFANSLFAATSTDSGASWGAPITVGSPGSSHFFRVKSISSTSAGIVWYSFAENTTLTYATVTLGASAASVPVIINPDRTAPYERLPSLAVSGDVRVVTWIEASDVPVYMVSASCDAGATWSAPLQLAGGENLPSEDAVSFVSGGVFTTSWGMYSADDPRAFVFASSTDAPCATVSPAVLPPTGSDMSAEIMLLLGVVLLGVGAVVVVRRRATVQS